jgi:hypothetical protein
MIEALKSNNPTSTIDAVSEFWPLICWLPAKRLSCLWRDDYSWPIMCCLWGFCLFILAFPSPIITCHVLCTNV